MKPLRMCMVCRERHLKEDLIRICKNSQGEISVDQSGKMPGRGAYICKSGDCISLVRKRKGLERAFSCKIEPEIYSYLCSFAEVSEDEL
ncbi:MAG: YlxR family protein [Clostridia bacterium]|nr:YlxR family protein [Clostridia bacterium]